MNIFWLNNIHFALEFFGAIALVAAAWLAFDAYLLTREKKALLKVFGFGFFGAWQALHALDVAHEPTLLGGMILLIAGLFLLALNMHLESPPARPKIFELVFVIPSVAGLLGNAYVAAGILACSIAALAARRHIVELNKPLRSIWLAFGFLGLSFFAGSVSAGHLGADAWWAGEHALRAVGFGALIVWVWQYLTLRLRESLLLIFVAMALTVSLVVTFTFSALLLSRMRADAMRSLQADARVFSYTLKRLSAEAKVQSELASHDRQLQEALAANDFARIEERAMALRSALGVDFVTVADAQGAILQRATYRTSRGETLESDPVARRAVLGEAAGDVAVVLPEGLSVRGASRIASAVPGVSSGSIVVGMLLDNVFLDAFKGITGLDATLLNADAVYASTIREGADGARLATGAQIGNALAGGVLEGTREYAGSVSFFGRPHLASLLPLYNLEGSAVGMVAASRPEVEIAKAAVATNRLTLLTTLAIVFALLVPAYLVVRRLTDEGM